LEQTIYSFVKDERHGSGKKFRNSGAFIFRQTQADGEQAAGGFILCYGMGDFRPKFWRLQVFAFCLLLVCFDPGRAFSRTSTNAEALSVTYMRDVLPILVGRCYACHNDQVKFLPDWSDYQTAFNKRLEIRRRVWDSWKGHYYKEPMPAGYSPQTLAMTEADRLTIKLWVDQGAVRGVLPPPQAAGSKSESIELGRRLFAVTCAPCHQATGQGIPDRFPPLAASDFLNSDKRLAIKTVLNGRQGEITVNGHAYNNSMPKFPLSDEQVADVLSYVYNSFGNSGRMVTPEEVKNLRAQKDESVSARPLSAASSSSPFE
jgi:mono/diheme cytochrome c family protein